MKKLCLLILILLNGCAIIKDAHTEMKREFDGFNREWARVILKQEVKEY
jgi:uncharacterized protein YceK